LCRKTLLFTLKPFNQSLGKCLKTFKLIVVDVEIAEKAINLRQRYRLKIPDAVILVSAEHCNAL